MALNTASPLLCFWAVCCLQLQIHCQHSVGSSNQEATLLPGRRLKQIDPVVLTITTADPVSATTADLKNDPTGRGHLLVSAFIVPKSNPHRTRSCGACISLRAQQHCAQARLSNAADYVEQYTYMQSSFPPEVFGVPWTVDPTAANGLTGKQTQAVLHLRAL